MICVYVGKMAKGTERREQSEQARRLLNAALTRECPEVRVPPVLERERGGKPYLKDYPSVFINLSHSGSYVACVLGDKPVGVDVEVWKKHRNTEGMIKKFHPLEQEAYACLSGEEREAFFYELWVAKESFLKAVGAGLRMPLGDFCALPGTEVIHSLNEKHYYTRLYSISEGGCSLAVCSEGKDFPKSWKRLENSGLSLLE